MPFSGRICPGGSAGRGSRCPWWNTALAMAAGTHDPHLADALDAERPKVGVVLVEAHRVDVEHVGVGGHVVAGQVTLAEVAERRVEGALLVQRHREAHRHAPDQLRPGGDRVDDPAGGEHAEQPGTRTSPVSTSTRLRELGAEREPGTSVEGADRPPWCRRTRAGPPGGPPRRAVQPGRAGRGRRARRPTPTRPCPSTRRRSWPAAGR